MTTNGSKTGSPKTTSSNTGASWRYGVNAGLTLLVFAVVVGAWWYVGTRLPTGCRNVQPGASFAGSPARFDDLVNSGHHPGATCTAAQLQPARAAFGLNALLGIVAAVVLFVLMAMWLRRAVFTRAVRTWLWRSSFLPLAAGVLNIAVAILAIVGLHQTGSPKALALRAVPAWILPGFAWPVLVFFAIASLALLVEVVSARGNTLLDQLPAERARETRPPLSQFRSFCVAHLRLLDEQIDPVTKPEIPPEAVHGLGISCSGGGIRAGSIALGVLSSLEGHRADGNPIEPGAFDGRSSILDRASYVSSVSGGGYTTAAWRIARGTSKLEPFDPRWTHGIIGNPWDPELDVEPPEAYDSDQSAGPASLYRHIRARQQYLRTGRGGLALSALRVIGLLVLQTAILVALVVLVAWPTGRVARTSYVYGGPGCSVTAVTQPSQSPPAAPDLGTSVCRGPASASAPCNEPASDPYLEDALTRTRCFLNHSGVQMPITGSMIAALILFGSVAVVVFAFTLGELHTRRRRALRVVALAFAGVSTLLALLLVGIPLLLDVAYPYVTTTLGVTLLISAASAGGLIATVMRFVTTQLKRRIDVLGKVLVAVAALLLAILVAGNAATGQGPFAAVITYCVIAAFAFVAIWAFDPRWWSLHVVYRDRIRNAFSTTWDASLTHATAITRTSTDAAPRLFPLPGRNEPTLDEYADPPGPKHLICCSVARNTRAVSGIPALSFVLSGDTVALYEPDYKGEKIATTTYAVPTNEYVDALGGPRRDRGSVARKHATGTTTAGIAMSGAAVASAMGRFDPREPTSLFAVLNLRLGVWMPNPGVVQLGDPRMFKPRLTYLLKEIAGYFERDDRHVYVTDGGHRENLGLVELLRRRCRTIVCVDASGDAVPGSFTTLRQAAALARLEVGARIDLSPLENPPPLNEQLPLAPVGHHVLDVHYDEGGDAKIIYLGAQLYESCPPAIAAFRCEDRDFPNYSTGNQFLSDKRFANLVKFGRSMCDDALGNPDVRAAIQSALGDSDSTAPARTPQPV